MKVCVLSLHRTSSTNLFYVISSLNRRGLKISEPFNRGLWSSNDCKIHFTKINDKGSVFTKLMYNNYDLPYGFNLEEYLEWIKKTFSHVICLYRKDIKLQSESYIYHHEQQKKYVINWHQPKIIDISCINPELIKKTINEFRVLTDELIQFSNKNSYLLVSYEDLIIDEGNNETFKEIFKYIGLEFNYENIYTWYRKEKKVRLSPEDFKINKLI